MKHCWSILLLAFLCSSITAQDEIHNIQTKISAAQQQLLQDSFFSPSYRLLAPLKYQLRSIADSSARKLDLQFQLYDTYLEVVNGMIASTINPESKKLAYRKELPAFETGIATAYQLFQQKADDQYFQWAFHTAEQNRNLLLSNSLYTPISMPDHTESELGRLLSAINIAKSKLTNAKRQNNQSQIVSLENLRDSLKSIYNQQMEQIAPWPKLSDLDENNAFEWDSIQSKLQPKEALIEYFYGRDSVYVFVLTAHSKTFQNLASAKSIQLLIQSFQQSIYHQKENWYQANTQLYQLLFHPIRSFLTDTDKLIIVPDGILGAIPFQSLCPEAEEWDRSFKTLDYLIYHYDIHYHHSAKALFQEKPAPIFEPNALALAPVFDSTAQIVKDSIPKNLNALPLTPQLLKNIKRHYQGHYLTHASANFYKFSQEAPHADIIHFSTHTLLHPNIPMYTQIMLYPTSTSSAALQLKDIYLMAGQLNCDLAVLGSCQSGSGPISEGESLSGLAYGFSYLGVPSLIYSLWAVDENATNQLFSQFYAYLKKGKDKSSALREAQIQYLQQANEETAAPFFWAGFILTGQNQAYTFQQQNPTNLWWWFAGSIVLIVLIFTQKTKIWAALNPSLRI